MSNAEIQKIQLHKYTNTQALKTFAQKSTQVYLEYTSLESYGSCHQDVKPNLKRQERIGPSGPQIGNFAPFSNQH